MPPSLTEITILVENTTRQPGLLGEHGWSAWLATGRARVLFDTGAGVALSRNATALGIDLGTADAVVLSHGHYDHSGGLRDFCGRAQHARLFLHPEATRPRFSRHADRVRSVGTPYLSSDEVAKHGDRLVWTEKPTEVVPGLFVTGQIPRRTPYEDTGGAFCLDAACTQPDPLFDDQALYFDTVPGTVVVLGCAHAGIINTLQHVRELTGGRPIHAVLGGTHLLQASPERLDQTITALRALAPRVLAPAHCTGARALAALWAAFPESIAECAAGARFTFGS